LVYPGTADQHYRRAICQSGHFDSFTKDVYSGMPCDSRRGVAQTLLGQPSRFNKISLSSKSPAWL
jgi:hypothetical protein